MSKLKVLIELDGDEYGLCLIDIDYPYDGETIKAHAKAHPLFSRSQLLLVHKVIHKLLREQTLWDCIESDTEE